MSIHETNDTVDRYMGDNPHQRPSSIDLSLELERQLEIDSLPNSPVVAHTRITERPQSLDPQVLTSIVTQLRLALGEVTKERENLSQSLAESQAREHDLKDALHTVSERCLQLEAELVSVSEKGKEDADAVTMLRGKLEDSRRALMRLQTENRKSSMTIDLSRAGPSTAQGPPSARRSSFAPLVTSPNNPRMGAHRRISSVSEPGLSYRSDLSSPPMSGRLEPLQLVNAVPSPADRSARRLSGFFGRSGASDLPPTADASEVEELRKELQAIREQLEESRHELTEAREAQEASETCVNALRTFIADNSIGMHPVSRNHIPSVAQDADAVSSRKNSGWGFKLWNTTGQATSIPTSAPAGPNASMAPLAVAVPPLTKKIGGFFSSRSSISSTSSTQRREPHSHPLEPMLNGSDSSSIDSATEPLSPASELPPASIAVHSFEDSPSRLSASASRDRTKDVVQHEQQLDTSI
ncbi:hypothetical protein BDW22DRAFT_1239605 [Trametopsis cervina]|nr:hypothetical protein BDW22DRAFT_1239605 [Trametopsis cervina]